MNELFAPTKWKTREEGISLVSVLIAIIVFAFGSLALVNAYVKSRAVVTDNKYYLTASNLAESLRGTLIFSTTSLAAANGFSTDGSSGDTQLVAWGNRVKNELPSGSATVKTVDPVTSSDKTCTTAPCTVQVTISWQKDLKHTKTYLLQIGF